MLNIISLGAGVQSTTVAIMAARGDLNPMPDAAVFADTGWEPGKVYDHLDWLEGQLPFPVYRVRAKIDIRANILNGASGKRWASIPAFTNGGAGQVMRQCTKEFKLEPIRRKVRQLAGIHNKKSPDAPVVTQWIGISLDELIRAKPSFEPWQVNIFPLIEKRMSRQDCLKYLRERQYPTPPKSACIGCPYASDERWADMRKNQPLDFADAVEMERAMHRGQFRHMSEKMFLHRSGKPLDQVQLTPDERGQPDLFMNECEGMCGV